jgi:serine/threonine-protein kinase
LTEDKDREPAPSNASEYTAGKSSSDTTLASAGVERVLGEGSSFGTYTIGPCIAQGRLSRIYSARHEGLRRQVALKLLVEGFARNPDGVERFLREARNAAAIKHPNVVDIFDVGIQQDIPYLVMELLEGEDLATRLSKRGPLTEAELIEIMVPVVAGLSAVHDAGVLHRNLKPANVFIARGRNDEVVPKLVDFGISKAVWSDQLKLTLPNRLLMGTPSYMSPEAIRGAPMTALSDQYSLGVVMYECVTGKNPCDGESFADTLRIITTGDYDPPTKYKPQLSRHLTNIIARTMSLEPADRFTDLRELGRELLMLAGKRTRITWDLSFGENSRALSRRAAVTTVIELAPEAHLRTSARPRRRGVVLFMGAVATVAALGAAVFAISNPRLELPSLFSRKPPANAVAFPLTPAANRAPTPSSVTADLPELERTPPAAVSSAAVSSAAVPRGAVPPPALGLAPSTAAVTAPPSAVPATAAPALAALPAPSHLAGPNVFANPGELREPMHANETSTVALTSERRNIDIHRVGSESRIRSNPSWLLPSQAFPPTQRISSGPARSSADMDNAPMPQIGANNAPILD